MNVHNIMEELVFQATDNMYEQVKKEGASWLTCDCQNCRLDTVSYVLNRMPPRYVVSGRGVTHSTELLDNSSQINADIGAMVLEGMRIVSTTKRPFHSNDREECTIQASQKPAFNFHTFIGTVLDGTTFEPVPDATITLKCNGKIADMVDKTWNNPYTTHKSTNGAYSFWVRPVPTRKAGVTKTFKFGIEVSAEGYDDIAYHFELPVTSEASVRTELDSTYSLKIKNLYLFKTEDE